MKPINYSEITANPAGSPQTIITTRAVRDRYAATLAEMSRQRHEAAYEWSRLRWWQWRKRRRLYRVLFGIGGWRVPGLEDSAIPQRVVLRWPRRMRVND